jgi:hypothetical protein
MSRRQRIIVIVLACFAGAVLFAALVWHDWSRFAEGRAATLEELRRADVLPDLVKGLPPGATDILYYCHFHSGDGEAWFAIDTAGFLVWAESRGRQVERVSAEHPRRIRPPGVAGVLTVEDGYFWEREIGVEFYEKAVFDARAGRAYYRCILGHYGRRRLSQPPGIQESRNQGRFCSVEKPPEGGGTRGSSGCGSGAADGSRAAAPPMRGSTIAGSGRPSLSPVERRGGTP